MPTASDRVKDHPRLLCIVSALLEGRPCSEIAQEFSLESAAVRAYAREAGLEPGKPLPLDPEKEPPESEPEDSPSEEEPTDSPQVVEDRTSVHEREQLEESARRRGDPEGQRPEADAHPYNDEHRSAIRQLLSNADVERQAYLSQPRPFLTLCSDPDFRIGFQPQSRLLALVARERSERAEKVRQWYAEDAFRWGQPPPDDL